MSVLIKGMEMPPNCAECGVQREAKCKVDCWWLQMNPKYYECRKPDCPLIEQPEPIKIQIDHKLTHDELMRLCKDMADAPIVLMPSAQPDRRKGRWVKHGIGHENVPWGFDCSRCGEWFVIDSKHLHHYKYCPNCGADMREAEDEP